MPEIKKIMDSKSPLEKFREVFTELSSPKGGLPTMPTMIAEHSSIELGNIMSKYASWREYTEDRHMEACAVYAQVKSEYDLACDKEMLISGADTVTERKAEAKTSSKVAKLHKDLVDAEIYKDLFAAKLESFSNVLAILSRELTRRGVELS